MSLRVKCTYAEMEPYACHWCGELNDLIKVRDVILDLIVLGLMKLYLS